MIWRIVTSRHMKENLITVENDWSFDDLMTANTVLDAYADAEAQGE